MYQVKRLVPQIKHFVQRVGGNDMPSFIRMSIKAVISNELAIGLTWRGTLEKPSIQEFATFKIIKDKFKFATVADINSVCQQHVLHARDRVQSRQKKMEHRKSYSLQN